MNVSRSVYANILKPQLFIKLDNPSDEQLTYELASVVKNSGYNLVIDKNRVVSYDFAKNAIVVKRDLKVDRYYLDDEPIDNIISSIIGR